MVSFRTDCSWLLFVMTSSKCFLVHARSCRLVTVLCKVYNSEYPCGCMGNYGVSEVCKWNVDIIYAAPWAT